MSQNALHLRLESDDFATERVQLHKIEGVERLSRMFEFNLELISTDPKGLNRDHVIAANVALVFSCDGEQVRRVHGVVCEVDDLFRAEAGYWIYRLKVVPRMWRTTLVRTFDIFMDMSVPDIIRKKLELSGLGAEGVDFELRLLESYPPREFVVQHDESDFDFICRLAEHEGISYFFEHDDDRDKIVFADNAAAYRPFGPDPSVQFRPRGEAAQVFHFEVQSRLIAGTYVVNDYNYRTPSIDIHAVHRLAGAFGGGVIEYGTHAKTPAEAERFARIRAEEHDCQREVFRGTSDIQRLAAGSTFLLTNHPGAPPPMAIVQVRHQATQVVATGGADEERTYTSEFEAIPFATPFRPPRTTPKPRVHGVLTGVVEPDPDNKVGTVAKIDDQGRYRVKFLFDTAPHRGVKASRPIRRLQPTAGPNYGMHFPLRPGVEVLLAFVNGDPDRPVIVGAVPNPLTPSPVNEKDATLNRIRTQSGVLIEIGDSSG